MPNLTWAEIAALVAFLLAISNLIKNWWNGSRKLHKWITSVEDEDRVIETLKKREDEKLKELEDRLNTRIAELKEFHLADDQQQAEINKQIMDEQTVIIYGVLACLKGLVENGADGPCHEAIDKIEKHLNKSAHSL